MIATYQDLINTIADWLNRTDLNDSIPQFIVLAEGDIRVDLRSRGVLMDTTVTIDDGSIVLPSDVKVIRSLYDSYGEIRMASPERVAEINARYPSGGQRANYAAIVAQDTDDTDSLILLSAPIPQEDITITIIYEPDLVALSSDNTSNWLLRKHPNVYLYASLVHSAPYLRDEERVPLWDKMYRDYMKKLERLRDDIEFGAGPLVAMPRNAL